MVSVQPVSTSSLITEADQAHIHGLVGPWGSKWKAQTQVLFTSCEWTFELS
jgi:hypothetical protein